MPVKKRSARNTSKAVISSGLNVKRKDLAGTVTKSRRAEAQKLTYINVFRATPLERISFVKKGVPASQIKHMFTDLGVDQGFGFRALNLSAATVNKKARAGGTLSGDESERVIGFARLIGQLEAMLEDSSDLANFNPRAWLSRWLTEPLPALGGARPADLIDTMEGQGLVSSALAKLQSGAYA